VSLNIYRTKTIVLCFILALTFSGCDFIKSIKEYFQEPEDAPSAQTSPAAPAVVPQQSPTPAQPTAATPMAADVLARVGKWSLTVQDFEDRLVALKEVVPEYDITDPEARRLVLDELINQQVLVEDAEAKGVAAQKDIQAAVEEFRRTLIIRQIAQQITENITVPESDALAFYEENKEAMVGPAQWHVSEIVVPTKEQATTILSDILKGMDFAETAKQYSTSKTAVNGGDMGFIEEEPFPQMGKALVNLEPGDVSSVFDGPDGFYIVKLLEKKGGEPISFEEIKEDIIQNQTLLMQQQAILDHLNRLKATTKIEINEELLK
jgi:parvulin-like peptidyl-prolyl isomerase